MSNNQKNILNRLARYFHTSHFIITIGEEKVESKSQRWRKEGVSIPREVPCVIILDSCILERGGR